VICVKGKRFVLCQTACKIVSFEKAKPRLTQITQHRYISPIGWFRVVPPKILLSVYLYGKIIHHIAAIIHFSRTLTASSLHCQ
jgi:hypothetical protein